MDECANNQIKITLIVSSGLYICLNASEVNDRFIYQKARWLDDLGKVHIPQMATILKNPFTKDKVLYGYREKYITLKL